MSGLFGGGGAPALAPAPAPPMATGPTSGEIAAKSAAARARLSKQRGRASTILTGGEGVTEQANVAKKTLLGE